MANREQKRRMNKKGNKTNTVKEVKKEKGFFESKLGLNEEMASFVKTILVVLVSFLVVLCITLLLNKLGVFEEGYSKPQRGETVILYDEILVGSVFNRSDSVYYVVFDKFGSSEADYYLNQKLSGYDGEIPVYSVDMTKGINEKYLSDESNIYASKVSELKIKVPTMIKISNGFNVGYFEGTDNIVNELYK